MPRSLGSARWALATSAAVKFGSRCAVGSVWGVNLMVGSVGGWSAAAVASRELLRAVSRVLCEGGAVIDVVGVCVWVVAAFFVPCLFLGGAGVAVNPLNPGGSGKSALAVAVGFASSSARSERMVLPPTSCRRVVPRSTVSLDGGCPCHRTRNHRALAVLWWYRRATRWSMVCMGLVVTGQVCTTGGCVVVVVFVAAIMLTVALTTLLRASGSVLDFPDTYLMSNWYWSSSLSQRHSLELVSADRAQYTSGLWSVWSSTVNFELAIRKVRHCLHAFTRAKASRSPVEYFISGGVNFALNHSSTVGTPDTGHRCIRAAPHA